MPILPTMTLNVEMSVNGETDFWTEDDNTGDPYLNLPYRWEAYMYVLDQTHSNHTTQTPNAYNALDIKVGDWFASGFGGRANLIVEIKQASGNEITCILEDYERFNLFSDPNMSGYGLANSGPGIIFRLDGNGFPDIGPIPENYLAPTAITDLQARFMARNGLSDFVLVRQIDHGFFPGDVIYADSVADTGYKKVDRNNIQKALGIVTEVNVPGLYYFSYRPLGRLINNVNPPLWGQHGDTYYLDPNEPGALTIDKPALNAIPVYFQLDLPTRAIQLERGIEVAQKSQSETNKYDVENVASGQTTFTLPSDAKEVLYMAINGIENENFTFDTGSKVLVFDPVETGYGVDVDDEVFFMYKS